MNETVISKEQYNKREYESFIYAISGIRRSEIILSVKESMED
ncbi:hypothetical protein NE664_11080 [Anaerotignum faecicola]|nr:hypothetical protein [Anaerotignum faecicola]